jgi:hypothetical protein
MDRGYKALLDRLVRAAVAGNAWNAGTNLCCDEH